MVSKARSHHQTVGSNVWASIIVLAIFASIPYFVSMNNRHRKTLAAVFTDPVSGTIEWAAVENLLLAAGTDRRARVTGAV